MSTFFSTNIFGESIRNLRKSFGYTQRELSQAVNVSVVSIQKWESGETLPSLEALISLSRIFMMPIDNIVYGLNYHNIEGLLSSDELLLLEDYKKLDERGRAVIRSVIDEQLKWI